MWLSLPPAPYKIGVEKQDGKEIRNLFSGPTGREDQPNGRVWGQGKLWRVSTGILNACFRRQIRG